MDYKKLKDLIDVNIDNLLEEHSCEYVSIVEQIFDRIDLEEVSESNILDVLYSELDSVLIYYDDMWEIARDYTTTPAELDWDDCLGQLISNCQDVYMDALADYLLEDDDD